MTEHAIDYSWARPAPGAIRAAGYTGVLRYVSRPDNNGKNITANELRSLRAAGLAVTLNFEQYERRPLEGFTAGVQDAISADVLADKVGYPATAAIYYSVDFGTTYSAVREYFRGVHSASRRAVGVYGGLPIIRGAEADGFARYGWVTNAASWSGYSSWTALANEVRAHPAGLHLLQHLHSNTPLHVSGVADDQFDPNTVLNPSYGQWGDTNQEDDVTPAQEAKIDATQLLATAAYQAALRVEQVQLKEVLPRSKRILKALTGKGGQVRQLQEQLAHVESELAQLNDGTHPLQQAGVK